MVEQVSNTITWMEKPRAVLFDAYGTLFDVYSVGLLAEQLFPGHGQALGVLWRDKQVEYTRLVTTSNDGAHYRPFWDLTRAALRYACKRLGLNHGRNEAFDTSRFKPPRANERQGELF